MTLTLKLIPAEEEHTPLLISAHKSTQKLDTLTAYRRAYTYGPTKVVVKKDGDSKIVMSMSSDTLLFACVPSTTALSLGIATHPVPDAQPFTTEASYIVSNASPPAAAAKAGATMLPIEVGIDPPSVPPVLTGKYLAVKHPGDVSWQSADGTQVVSWWGGGRYATSAQLLYGTRHCPTWADFGALADGNGLSPVRSGTLPESISSATDLTTAISRYADGAYGVAAQYGVWLNGGLLYKSKPGMAHMLRTVEIDGVEASELVSLVGYAAGGAGIGVSFTLRTVSEAGLSEVALLLPTLDAARGVSPQLTMTAQAGSWINQDWYKDTCVLYDAANTIGDQNIYYSCYGHFSPDGTKLFILGTTSGPNYLEPWLMDNHVAADYRLTQVFECDIPAELTGEIQMTLSEDVKPSHKTQVATQASAASFTPEAIGTVKYEILDKTALYKTPGFNNWSHGAPMRAYGEDNAGSWNIVSETSAPRITWNRVTSELVPFVDWLPDSSRVVAPRKIFTADRTYERESWSGSRSTRYTSEKFDSIFNDLVPVNNSIGGSTIVEYQCSLNNIGNIGGTTTSITTTYRAYHSNGTFSETAVSTNPPIINVVGDTPAFRTLIGAPATGGTYGTPGFNYIINIMNYLFVTFNGESIQNQWRQSSGINIPYETVAQLAAASPRPTSRITGGGLWYGDRTQNTQTRTTMKNKIDDAATVKYRLEVPEGFAKRPPELDVTFYTNTYAVNYEQRDGNIVSNTSSLTFTQLPVWSDVHYCDTRWPVLHVGTELLWFVTDDDNNVYYPGIGAGGSVTEATITTPSDYALDDTSVFPDVGVTYAQVTPAEVLPDDTGRSHAKFVSQGAPFSPASFSDYVPDDGVTSYTEQYLSGDYRAGIPATEERYERAYHYDISPDTEPAKKVLFGLSAYQANWPNGWGSLTSKKPALWFNNGERLPVALDGLYGEGVTYMSPLFLAPYRQV